LGGRPSSPFRFPLSPLSPPAPSMASGRLAPALGALTVAGGALASYTGAFGAAPREDKVVLGPVPTRSEAVARLRDSSPGRPFDVLIIGGGATGAGCAVDAATR
jgi:glycerol-3-phosphate dehydrogenase